jgi:hypothetical protein
MIVPAATTWIGYCQPTEQFTVESSEPNGHNAKYE